jgi:hypothetical protein
MIQHQIASRLVCLFGLAICLIFCGTAAASVVPDPSKCVVVGNISEYGLLVAPGPLSGTSLTITVLDATYHPIPGASVWVVFDPSIHTCENAQIIATANGQGICTLQLRAGGCVRNGAVACALVANGVEIRRYRDVKSPDNAGHQNSAPDGAVAISDLAFFADEFLGVAAAACHDYDNDGACDIADMPFFGDSFTSGIACNL